MGDLGDEGGAFGVERAGEAFLVDHCFDVFSEFWESLEFGSTRMEDD